MPTRWAHVKGVSQENWIRREWETGPTNVPERSAAPEEPTRETIEDIVNKMGALLATPEAKQKYFDLVIKKGFV